MKTKNISRFEAIKQWLLWILVVLLLIAGGVYLWAWSATDTNLIARGIIWGDSDAGDLHRFPARTMQPSTEPVEFEKTDGKLTEILNGLPISNSDIDAVDMPFNEYRSIAL